MKSLVLSMKKSFKEEFLTTFMLYSSVISLIVLGVLSITNKIDKYSAISILFMIVLYNILVQIKELRDDIKNLNK